MHPGELLFVSKAQRKQADAGSYDVMECTIIGMLLYRFQITGLIFSDEWL
jgi:hypothetical protein